LQLTFGYHYAPSTAKAHHREHLRLLSTFGYTSLLEITKKAGMQIVTPAQFIEGWQGGND
jgi:hypothetical protein